MSNSKNYIKNGYNNEQQERGENRFDADKLGLHKQELQGIERGGKRVRQILNLFQRSQGNSRLSEQEQLDTFDKYVGDGLSLQTYFEKYKNVEWLKSGWESGVYLLEDKNGIKKVIKETFWQVFPFKSENQLVEFVVNKIVLQNTIFPETFYNLIGFTVCGIKKKKRKPIQFLLKQPYIEPLKEDNTIIEVTLEELDENMLKRGFKREGHVYISDDYIISDLIRPNTEIVKTDNVIIGKDERFYYIDPVIKLNSENRSYNEFIPKS
jgi:hypothetical protein